MDYTNHVYIYISPREIQIHKKSDQSPEAMNVNQLGDFEVQLRSLRLGERTKQPGIMGSYSGSGHLRPFISYNWL